MGYKIGVSGHRKLDNPEKIRKDIREFLSEKKKEHPDFTGISALAEGVDTIFAEEALNQGIPVEVILPFPIEYYQDTFTDQVARETLHSLFKQAKIFSTILEKKPEESDERRQAYLDCGKRTVDNSDFMLFVFNGEAANGKGGTGDIFNYCKEKNKNHLHMLAFKDNEELVTAMEAYRNNIPANKEKKLHNNLWNITLLFAASAAVILSFSKSFMIALEGNLPIILAIAETLLFFIAVICYLYLEGSKTRGKRISHRRDSQVLKRYIVYLKSYLPVKPLPDKSIYDPYISKDVINLVQQVKPITSGNFTDQKKGIKDFLEKQKEWFEKDKKNKIHKKMKIVEGFQKVLVGAFVLGIFILFLINVKVFFSKPVKEVATFISLSFPIVLGALEAYIYFNDDRRTVLVSEYMSKFCDFCLAEINNVNAPPELYAITDRVWQKFDEENMYWCFSTDANAINKIG